MMNPTAADVAEALGGRRVGSGWSAPCPAHDDRHPSLSVGEGDDGRVLVKCFAGCEQARILAELRRRGLWTRTLRAPFRPVSGRSSLPLNDGWKGMLARSIWRQGQPAAGTEVEAYLQTRGITIPSPPTLRFARNLWHAPSREPLPAMVAAVQNLAGEIIGIHRTFLAPGGVEKATVEPAKMMLGPCSGGAVRLSAATSTLAICEGIETGLSVMQATGLPTWIGLSAHGVEALELPPLPIACNVIIFADHDSRGIEAAQRTGKKFLLQGRRVWIPVPALPDSDFNDVLRGIGGVG